MSGITITKVDGQPTKKHKRTMRTFPRGVLKRGGSSGKTQKIKPVADPAKPPTSKGTLRVLTTSGESGRRKTIKHKLNGMNDEQIRNLLKVNKVNVSDKAPPSLAKEIAESGMEAGLIVAPSS